MLPHAESRPHATLLGLSWDGSSSFEPGAAGAPPLIRQALWSPTTNTWNEQGDDIALPGVLEDAGDLSLGTDAAAARAAIEAKVRELVTSGRRPLCLGGDHSVTYPILAGFRGQLPALTILHFDAHSDLYEEFDGDRYSHACPFARILEEGLATRLVQVGIRCMTAHLRSQVERFGVEVFTADRWRAALPVVAEIHDPVYVSLDLDVLEPMLAPGLSHPEPGGLLVRDVLEVLAALPHPIVGADIVEYNPRHDVRDLTARVAAKFIKELVGKMRAEQL
jgi:arginase